jgi:hypothetical protein
MLLIFNNFKNFEDFILNLNWLIPKEFFKIVLVSNYCSDIFQAKIFNKRNYKVTFMQVYSIIFSGP